MGGGVRRIVLDESVLFGCEDPNGKDSLLPAAEYLLRKLRHSTIPTEISYRHDLSAQKASLLQGVAVQYSFDCFVLDESSTIDALNEIQLAWGDIGGSILYLVSDNNDDLLLKLRTHGWLLVILRSTGQESKDDVDGGPASEDSSMFYINKLEELPLTICRLNKKDISNDVVTVGYIMKPSREEDFSKRGAFPMHPSQNGLIFMPLTFALPISSQLQEVDVVLHKATDEIMSIKLNSSSELSNRITYTRGMLELGMYMEHHPDFCLIDPFNNIDPVVDRLKIQQILLGLEDINRPGCCRIRGPYFLKVDNFNELNLIQRLSEAKLSLPSIVKPQVACGVADAHSMAIVFRVEDYKDLSVPLPAVIQEYVDHSSTLFKFYVLGEKVFYAVKKSTPNAGTLKKLCEKNELKPLIFDSLKSLPTGKENQNVNDQSIDIKLVTDAASWLRRVLDLTIFGFDVVIQEGSGDHVIVDVNYLPSFKEVPDNTAIPAFWDAIKEKFESRKKKQAINSDQQFVDH